MDPVETVGKALFVTVTSSNTVQVPLVTDHRSVAVVPTGTAVIAVVGEPVIAIEAVPDCNDQEPVPDPGVVCVMVKFPLLHFDWLGWSLTEGDAFIARDALALSLPRLLFELGPEEIFSGMLAVPTVLPVILTRISISPLPAGIAVVLTPTSCSKKLS